MMRHTSRFTSPVVTGSVVRGISEGPSGRGSYTTDWSGIYEGIRLSEWTGEPVHFFRDGIIGETPQHCFTIPVSHFQSALFAWGHGACAGTFTFHERLPAATVFACGCCGQHRVAQDDPEASRRAMAGLADLLIEAAEEAE